MASSSDFAQQFPGTSKRVVNAEMAADQWPEGQRQDPAANAMAQCAVYSGLRDPRSMVGNPCFEQFGPLFGKLWQLWLECPLLKTPLCCRAKGTRNIDGQRPDGFACVATPCHD